VGSFSRLLMAPSAVLLLTVFGATGYAVEIPKPIINIPKPNIPRPTINIPRPNVTVNAPKPTINVPRPTVVVPNVPKPTIAVTVPKVDVPHHTVAAPKIDVPNKPAIAVTTPKAVDPKVDVSKPTVAVTAPKRDLPNRTFNLPETNAPKSIMLLNATKGDRPKSADTAKSTTVMTEPKTHDGVEAQAPRSTTTLPNGPDPSKSVVFLANQKKEEGSPIAKASSSKSGGFVDCTPGNPSCNDTSTTSQTTQFPKANPPPPQGAPTSSGGSAASSATLKTQSTAAEPLPGYMTGGPDGCVGCKPGHTYILTEPTSTCPQGNCAYTYNPGNCGSSGACWTLASTTPANQPTIPSTGTSATSSSGQTPATNPNVGSGNWYGPCEYCPGGRFMPGTPAVQPPPGLQPPSVVATSPAILGPGQLAPVTPPPASGGSSGSPNPAGSSQAPSTQPSPSTNSGDFPKATVLGANPPDPATSYVLTIHNGTTLHNDDGTSDYYERKGDQWYQTHYRPDSTQGTTQPVGFGTRTDPVDSNNSGFYVYPILPNNTAGTPTMLPKNGLPQAGATPYRGGN
jgi:hypothetical protein